MPLLDHFHPPVTEDIQWNTFHAVWAGSIADELIRTVPREFQVREHLKLGGGCEIDVATLRNRADAENASSPKVSEWQPPSATSVPAVFPDQFEVLIYRQYGGRQLVAAIELISPGNKDDVAARVAFSTKVASYLHEGISVLIVDVVTDRHANLHNEIAQLMNMPAEMLMSSRPPLYACAYRPVLRNDTPQIDVWCSGFNVGDSLPTMPLRLIADYFVPVNLESTYSDARRRRLIG